MVRPRSGDLVGVAVGGTVLVATGALARRGVTEPEAKVFHRVNMLPDGAFRAIWGPMQYGAFGAVPALAAVAVARRRPRLAVAIGAAGTAAWLLAKAVKPVVGRGRPGTVLAGVRQRGEEEDDRGFPSGHAAVSTALTVVAWPSSSEGKRLASATLAGFVPLARLYVGAHMPLDVIGGSALGLAVACGINLVLGVQGAPTQSAPGVAR